MKTLEESVITAMDGSDIELLPYLHYILQDLWEMGTDPDIVITLIKKHFTDYANLKVLDLGCGKGPVSIKLSKALSCHCYGIDAMPEFIDYAQKKAMAYGVAHLCKFETGDIREKIKALSGYDIIILGAIGPVFGDYHTTLSTLSNCIHQNGAFIIDDGYIENNSDYNHPLILKQQAMLQQINSTGMKLIEEVVINKDEFKLLNDGIFDKIQNRCYELMEKYPDKTELFTHYLQRQLEENDALDNMVICSTMLINRK